MFALAEQTIFITLAGSHAHGTAHADSDVDLRGVAVAPLATRLSLFSEFEQHEGLLDDAIAALVGPALGRHQTASRSVATRTECVIFDLAKFIRLYQSWKNQRNEVRAVLEARFGYDTKHASHLIRLMRMGLEALREGELHVRRPDAAELTAIRTGALTFDQVLAAARALEQEMESAAEGTSLAADVDRARIDALAVELMTCA